MKCYVFGFGNSLHRTAIGIMHNFTFSGRSLLLFRFSVLTLVDGQYNLVFFRLFPLNTYWCCRWLLKGNWLIFRGPRVFDGHMLGYGGLRLWWNDRWSFRSWQHIKGSFNFHWSKLGLICTLHYVLFIYHVYYIHLRMP